MKVIIAGINGQDGSYLADYLLSAYDDIKIYGLHSPCKENCSSLVNIAPLLKDKRLQLRPTNYAQCDISLIKPDYFINFVGQSSVSASWTNPELTFQINTIYVSRFLEAIRLHAPNCAFFNAGSAEEFCYKIGAVPHEYSPTGPVNPYGLSKLAARGLVALYRQSYGLKASQGFLFNHESPRRPDSYVFKKIVKSAKFIAKDIEKGQDFSPIKLGNVNIVRDWSHASDIVRGIWKSVSSNPYSHKDYVFCSGRGHSIKDVVKQTFKLLNIEGEWINYENTYSFICKYPQKLILAQSTDKFNRVNDVDYMVGNPELAYKDFGWKTNVNLQNLILDIIQHP